MAFYLVKTKTSQCWGHKEYVYQVSSAYDDGNVEKDEGKPNTNSKFGEGRGIFFLKLFGKNQNITMVGA